MMRKLFGALLLASCIGMPVCASVSRTEPTEKMSQTLSDKAIKRWVKKGEWRNGFTASPDKSVNLREFYTQYHRNKAQWDAAFKWLAETDLLNTKAGSVMIPGTTLKANVQDGKNVPLKGHWTESHKRKIDFMYVVKGTEGFGFLDHATSTVKVPYDPKKDVTRYNFEVDKTKFFESTPGRFIICFPSDWHIPLLETKKKDQNIRVIVIKIDYVDEE